MTVSRGHEPGGRGRSTSRSRRAATLVAIGSLAVATAATGVLTAAPAQAAVVFVVNDRGDAPDAGRNGACATAARTCTLRAALMEAATAGSAATIRFAIGGAQPATITPATRLPPLTNRYGTTLDGWSQPGSRANTSATADNSVIGVQIMGKGPGTFVGLTLASSRNVVQGLAVYHFSKVIAIQGEQATGNRIVGNHICTDAAGTFKATRQVSDGLGVFIDKSGGNVVGAPGAATRNVISGCPHRGVNMSFRPTDKTLPGNKVQNNIVGLTPSGRAALPNKSHGVDINYSGKHVVGGDGAQERNVISGNDGSGIEVSHSRNTRDNLVVGNFIGTDLSGTATPSYTANKHWGIRMEGPYRCDTCSEQEWALPKEGTPGYNTVRGNVIAGNVMGGMHIDKGQHHNDILDNRIGVTASGAAGGNGGYGIRLEHGAHSNLVQGNEIAHNARGGITSVPNGSAPPGPAAPTNDNTFSRNSIHDNAGLGIDLAPLGQVNAGTVGDKLVNRGIKVPVLTRATATSVSGTTCAGCTVEVYRADGSGEGAAYLATGKASSSGAFTVAVPSAGTSRTVTALATEGNGSSSEFARTLVVPAG